MQESPLEWLSSETNPTRFSLERTAKDANSLYAKLCNAETTDVHCNFKSTVILEENLECIGGECDVASPQVIEVEEGIFYEYQRAGKSPDIDGNDRLHVCIRKLILALAPSIQSMHSTCIFRKPHQDQSTRYRRESLYVCKSTARRSCRCLLFGIGYIFLRAI